MSVIVNSAKDHKPGSVDYTFNDTMNSHKSSVVLTPRDWDPQFHGSVHTATIAVCIVLVIFVVILGTFGNGLVLLSSIQCKKLRSNFDILIYNLAAVDFIICACLSPIFLYLLFSDPPSPRGFCGGYLFLCIACGLQSLLTLVAIASYRQSRIRGLRGSLTGTKSALILLSIYTVSFASATGGTLQVVLNWDSSNSNCQTVINSNEILANNVILFFVSPIVIISFFLIMLSYIVIAKAVKLQTLLRTKTTQLPIKSNVYRQIVTANNNFKENNTTQELHQIAPSENILPPKKPKKRPSVRYCSCCSCTAALDKENKAVSMCYVVILIITLCWTPLIISHLVELITGESIILYQVKLCGIALVFLNSALDPYMYAQNNTRMKQRYAQVFWDMLRCECRAPPKPKFRTSSPGFLLPRKSPNIAICPEEGFIPFLQPKYKTQPVLTPYPRIEVQHTNLNYIKSQKKYHLTKEETKSALHLLLPPPNQKLQIVKSSKSSKRGNPQSVKTLVHPSCCNGNSPDNQSLMDSSLPHQ